MLRGTLLLRICMLVTSKGIQNILRFCFGSKGALPWHFIHWNPLPHFSQPECGLGRVLLKREGGRTEMAEEAAETCGMNEIQARSSSQHAHQFQKRSLIRLMDDSRTGVKSLVERGIDGVPSEFVRPLHQRPQPSQVCTARHIPLIDLEGLHGPRRPHILGQISLASQTWGFFQVLNHGVPLSVLEEMIDAVHRFHRQPAEEKSKYYTNDISMPVRYSPSFNILVDKVLEWKDALRIRYAPNPADFDFWPESCREAALNYCKHMRVLGASLLGLLSEALSLDSDYLIKRINCMEEQKLGMNYYPECPQPELTLGVGGHSDPGSLTVLLQDQVGGLQVSNEGHWVAVDPLPGSLVINLGDQIQILSNDRFKSVEHRAVTNALTPRVSIATFFSVRSDSSIGFGPIRELLNESQPALYREIGSDEYIQYFFNRGLDGKSCLEFARLK